jgi:two-component system, OmpR family, sensor histidine kinase MprB
VSLRVKLVLAVMSVAAVATIAVGVWSYRATGQRLRAEVDRSLDGAADDLLARTGPRDSRPPPKGPQHRIDGDDLARPRQFQQILVQTLDGRGAVVSAPSDLPLAVDQRDKTLAAAKTANGDARRDVTVDGERFRILTVPIGNGLGAVQVARSLAETNRLLMSLRNRTAIAVVLVIVVAGILAWLVSRRVTRRLVELTAAAEHVALTGELDVSVPVGSDETGRLGRAFNTMLGALHRSKEDQQRLVQDASHELRTPLTSLRTNISVLRRYDHLDPDTRRRLLDDLDGETRELAVMVDELVELATERRGNEPEQVVPLAEVAASAVERAQRRTSRPIELAADASSVLGRPHALERAIANLVENAVKFDDVADGPIDVTVRERRVEVGDRGPGFDPVDLPHIFDRFYRAVSARARPGSGLGLSIVRAVVESHGGRVFAENRAGGGAIVGFELPPTPTNL